MLSINEQGSSPRYDKIFIIEEEQFKLIESLVSNIAFEELS